MVCSLSPAPVPLQSGSMHKMGVSDFVFSLPVGTLEKEVDSLAKGRTQRSGCRSHPHGETSLSSPASSSASYPSGA